MSISLNPIKTEYANYCSSYLKYLSQESFETKQQAFVDKVMLYVSYDNNNTNGYKSIKIFDSCFIAES